MSAPRMHGRVWAPGRLIRLMFLWLLLLPARAFAEADLTTVLVPEGEDAQVYREASWDRLAALGGMAISPDGRLLAAAYQGKVRIWAVPTGRLVRDFPAKGSIEALNFSPDGRLLAVGQFLGTQLWEVETGRSVRILKEEVPTPSPGSPTSYIRAVQSVHFISDGKFLAATGSCDHKARLWEVATGQLVRVFSVSEGDITAVRFSPDGKLLATNFDTGVPEERGVRLWDVATGNAVRTIADAATTVSFSPDGKWIAAGTRDGFMQWNAATGEPVNPQVGTPQPLSVKDVAYSADGKLLIMALNFQKPQRFGTSLPAS